MPAPTDDEYLNQDWRNPNLGGSGAPGGPGGPGAPGAGTPAPTGTQPGGGVRRPDGYIDAGPGGPPQNDDRGAPGSNRPPGTQPPNTQSPAPSMGMIPYTTGQQPNRSVPTITGAPNVTAPTGTASTYNAQTATGAANVTAPSAGASSATASSYNATLTSVDPEKDLVESRVRGMIDSNSPLMQRAAQLANERSNARGMINSSIGTGAAQAALYDAATPIATTDAGAYRETRLANQNASNTALQTNAQLATQVSQTNAQLATQAAISNAQMALQAGIVNQQQANEIARFNASSANTAAQFNAASRQDMERFNLQQLMQAGIINQQQANAILQANAANATSARNADVAADTSRLNTLIGANNARDIAAFNAANQVLLDNNRAASSLYNTFMNNVAGLMNNNNMSPEARAAARDDMVRAYRQGMVLLGLSSSLPDLDLSGGPGGTDTTPEDDAARGGGGGRFPGNRT